MTRKGFKNVKLGKNVHRQMQRRGRLTIPKVKQGSATREHLKKR